MMETHDLLQTYLNQWRKAEDKFYGAALSAPELYMAGIKLVRGIVGTLADIETVESLLEAYPDRVSIDQVEAVGEQLEIAQRDFLDYNLAREAAFYLRYQEILGTQAKNDIQAKIKAARDGREAWVTLYNKEQPGRGVTFFQRLEMHLPDGLGIYSAIELDWEKGRVYVVEPLVLDSATGEPRREIRPPDPRQEFSNHEEMTATLLVLRQKYSAANGSEA